MKAVKITAPGRVVIEEQTKPVISPDEVLVKICYIGFCGSDLNTFRGKNPMAISPVIPGHEIGGIVEEIGSDVPAGLLEKGMSVTVNPYTACGKCSSCRRGRPNACRHNETMGVQRNGAMTDYIAVPWSKIIPAQGLTPRECALVEPMSVGFHAVDRAAVTDIDTVAVIGCGMIGLGAIVRAALRGATVIAIDLDDEKLALARELGATYSINSATSNLADELSRLTDGHGPDVVIEAVGSPFTYVAAVDNVAFCGRVVCIGYAKDDVSFHTKLFVQKELDIRGSRNAMPNDFAAVIRYFLAGGRKHAEKLISATVKPEETGDALAKWDAAPGKVFRILVEF
ncbi:MAG: zinc-binding alcohol dehydrogenase family protein [Duncaniella sp.]|nr:zinc-binding alcohol dehydrogenase family protein [Duncaniella sp.]MDE6765022.1 zinc-binding alcohol dehydrogenase family protein [Duncaniella sp.]